MIQNLLARFKSLSLGVKFSLIFTLWLISALIFATLVADDSVPEGAEFYYEGISVLSGEEVAAELEPIISEKYDVSLDLYCNPLDEVEGATTVCVAFDRRSTGNGSITVTYEGDGSLAYQGNPE